MEKTKQFIFLYPIKEYFDFVISNGAWPRQGREFEKYRRNYSLKLNRAIELRYRQEEFLINYVVFDNREVDDVISLHEGDKIVKTGKNFTEPRKLPAITYTKPKTPKGYYPNWNSVLSQLGKVEILRVAGFHLWDCVDRLARTAHERGIETLVDEDLTELFASYIDLQMYPQFRIDRYPTILPDEDPLGARNERPWLVQIEHSRKGL